MSPVRTSLVFLGLLSIPTFTAGQSAREPTPAAPTPPGSAASARIDSLLAAAHQRGIFNGSALVARDGAIVYEGEFGSSDAAGTVPLTRDHRFLIGSVGKEFSAVGLLVLHEEGALHLEAPVSRFVPSLPSWARRIRVRDLLRYTSGLPPVAYGEVENDQDIHEDLLALRELEFDPGTRYSYNNNDVFLRQRVIESASGSTYAEFVRTRLLEPCGMTRAVVDPPPGSAGLAGSFDDARRDDPWRSPMSGHVAVTARDLHAWTRCLARGELISSASFLELTRSFHDGAQSALGQSGVEDGTVRWHGHIGSIGSYEALEYVDRAAGITIILLTSNKQNRVGSLAGAIEQALQGKSYTLPKKSLELAVRARIYHRGFGAGMALLEEIERGGADVHDLSRIEDDLTGTGEYLLEMGRAEDALRVYELAKTRFPESVEARTGLVEARRRATAARSGGARATSPSHAPAVGDLRDQLARVDSLLFDALFVQCDAERANALLTEDAEFYDDRTGLSSGDDLRDDFRRLAANCPRHNGVRRIVLPHSVEVSPIEGYGAVQSGVHHFVERGASRSTVARFVHVWKRSGGEWRLARILSRHEEVNAEQAAAQRR